jgi:PTS system fructose-specific IIA component
MINKTHVGLITKKTILLNLDAESKFDAIRGLCGLLFSLNKTENPALLYQDIIKREEVVSTFAGTQTAIPHAITKHISEPTLCFARISNDDFTWDGKDEKVRFVFLLSAPAQDDLKKLRQSQSYVFSSVAQLISRADTLELWDSATDAQVILDSLNTAFEANQDR